MGPVAILYVVGIAAFIALWAVLMVLGWAMMFRWVNRDFRKTEADIDRRSAELRAQNARDTDDRVELQGQIDSIRRAIAGHHPEPKSSTKIKKLPPGALGEMT
jgi:hypothetical protein